LYQVLTSQTALRMRSADLMRSVLLRLPFLYLPPSLLRPNHSTKLCIPGPNLSAPRYNIKQDICWKKLVEDNRIPLGNKRAELRHTLRNHCVLQNGWLCTFSLLAKGMNMALLKQEALVMSSTWKLCLRWDPCLPRYHSHQVAQAHGVRLWDHCKEECPLSKAIDELQLQNF
jgi:hypothetical protein